MKTKHAEELEEAAYTTSLDQLTELNIQDALKIEEKEEITHKKERKVHCGRPITVRIMMRNPLATEIKVGQVKLVCSYKGDEPTTESDFECDSKDYFIPGKSTSEVILKVIPKKVGQIVIEKV